MIKTKPAYLRKKKETEKSVFALKSTKRAIAQAELNEEEFKYIDISRSEIRRDNGTLFLRLAEKKENRYPLLMVIGFSIDDYGDLLTENPEIELAPLS
ncbi:MAG: hypothetical protein ACE5FU_11795 [Nitrospinota bacterium]